MVTRKTTSTKPARKQKEEKEVLISEEQVWDVLKFAAQMYHPMYSNPILQNQRLQDVGLSPVVATSERVEAALQNPKASEKELVGFSEFFEITSMLYKRILYYMSGILSFDLTYTCKNATSADYKKTQYKNDLEILKSFLDSFDVKKEFKTVTRQIVRNEVYFSILREEGEKFTLQELPKNYSMITGRWDYGILFDFDMNWFNQAGIDIDMYPHVFKKMYDKTFGGKQNEKDYRASASIGERDGAWAKWAQTSPKDGFWAFKMNPELVTKIPFLAPLFPDVVIQPIIRQLQTNSYVASASKILVGKIPMLDKSVKGGATANAVAISPDVLGKFLSVLKAGLSESVKVGAAPLEDMQGISYPLDAPFYQEYLKTTGSSSGVNSRLIYTLDKNNAIESQLSINVDEFLMMYVYPQFNNFLEYHVNKKTKKFKWKFSFEGTEFFTNRKERFDTQMTLADKGIVLPQKIAASIGMLPHDFERQLEESYASDFAKKLVPIMSSYNMPAEKQQNKEAGRPSKSTSDLSESGVETRGNASNVNAGGDE